MDCKHKIQSSTEADVTNEGRVYRRTRTRFLSYIGIVIPGRQWIQWANGNN